MTNLRHPLRLNVGFLISAPIGTYRAFDFDYETMRLGDDLTVGEFIGTARFSRTPQGLVLQGDFQAETQLECVRCLDMFTQSLKWSVTELYAFDQSQYDRIRPAGAGRWPDRPGAFIAGICLVGIPHQPGL